MLWDFCFLGIQYVYTSSNLRLFSFFFLSSADVHHVATITLAQALGRHELVLQHLDGRTLVRIFSTSFLLLDSQSSHIHQNFMMKSFFPSSFFFLNRTQTIDASHILTPTSSLIVADEGFPGTNGTAHFFFSFHLVFL